MTPVWVEEPSTKRVCLIHEIYFRRMSHRTLAKVYRRARSHAKISRIALIINSPSPYFEFNMQCLLLIKSHAMWKIEK